MTRTEELQAALEVFEAMIEDGEHQMECRFEELLNNMQVKKAKQTIRDTLTQAIAKTKEAVTVPRIDWLNGVAIRGSRVDDSVIRCRSTYEANAIYEAARWVSENAGKPVNHSPDVGNMVVPDTHEAEVKRLREALQVSKTALNFYATSWGKNSYWSADGKPAKRLIADNGKRASQTLAVIDAALGE